MMGILLLQMIMVILSSFITSVEPLYAKIEAKNYNSDNNLFSVFSEFSNSSIFFIVKSLSLHLSINNIRPLDYIQY